MDLRLKRGYQRISGGAQVNYFLTEEQEMIRDLAAKIAKEKVAPVALEYDEKGIFP